MKSGEERRQPYAYDIVESKWEENTSSHSHENIFQVSLSKSIFYESFEFSLTSDQQLGCSGIVHTTGYNLNACNQE